MNMFRCIIISLLSIALAGCPARRPIHLAQQPEVITAQGTYTHAASGMKFPLAIGDFQRSEIFRYDPKGLDMSAGYDFLSMSGSVAATVYVYPARSLISIGSPPNVIAAARENLSQNEFEARKREIMNAHPGAILVQEGDIVLPQNDNPFAGKMATFEFEDLFLGHRQVLRSHLYLFCYAGGKWAIKYRFTHPKNHEVLDKIDNFMNSFPWTLTRS